MSENRPIENRPVEKRPVEKSKRSRGSKLIEFLFWVALAVLTAWLMIQNIERILPANNF